MSSQKKQGKEKSLLNKLKVLIVTVVVIIPMLAGISPAYAQHHPYPWPGNVPFEVGQGNARHHIIPMREMINLGQMRLENQEVAEEKQVEEVMEYLDKYPGIHEANLGEYDNNLHQLAKDYVADKSVAIDQMNDLFAWARGNLVIGPENRENDPGNAFDVAALNCRNPVQQPVHNVYDNLEEHWNEMNNEALMHDFIILSQQEMLPPGATEDCQDWYD
ncbi:MAG: hypothetical protein WBG70_09120 [Spirulinaceae cyanobacterium]